MLTIIDDVFKPIIGRPAWNVKKGIGSTLTFEFGDPHLVINEPKAAKPNSSKQLQRNLRRRRIRVSGAYHLWIEWCDWKAYNSGKLIGDHLSSTRIIKKVASELDGQALINIIIQKPCFTTFEFDLGGRLETMPGETDNEIGELNDQWSLFQADGKVFTLRIDGYYCYKSGRQIVLEKDWLSLF